MEKHPVAGDAMTLDTHRRTFGRRLHALAGASVAVASLLLGAPQQLLAQAPASNAGQPAAALSPARHVVTLITGDRVIASGANLETVRIEPGPGRDGVPITVQRVPVTSGGTHLIVIPADAAPLLSSGKVDRRLFDVTLLIESRYDDAHRSSLPLIVTYPRTTAARALPRVVPGSVTGRNLPSVNGMSVASSKAQVNQVWNTLVSGPGAFAAASEPIGKIWLDALQQPLVDHSVPQIGAPAAWGLGYEGDGVVVAVLDTGVDDAHPDLIDSVVVSQNFTIDPAGDQFGHGTHVASIIAGSGAASGGQYRGVAPGVSLLSGKVCEVFGCPESSIIAGMQWAAAEEGARVINMSLSGGDTPGLDPVEEAVETLSSQFGALFVIAAGNDGGFYPVGSAASTAGALAVGAVDRDDNVADFSSRGLTVDGALKPDITGPGVDIVASRAAGTELGTPVGDDYVTSSGTSMAAPHVAGAAALVAQQHPTWRGADIKAALMGTAVFNPAYTTLDQGAGRVDVAAALDASFLANATSLSLGIARWPHDDDAPSVRTLTYRNLGAATELAVELDIVAPDGSAAPAGMFSVTPSTIGLPEGGTASVRVTANTRMPVPDGLYSGRVIASDGAGKSLAIPLALVREEESYDLTLRHLDRQGEPAAQWNGYLIPYTGVIEVPWVFPTTALAQDEVLRLPKGRYAYEASIYGLVEPFDSVRIVAPNQLLDADELLVLDGSATTPVIIDRPEDGFTTLGVSETWVVDTDIGPSGLGFFRSGFDGDIAFYRGEVDPPEATLRAISTMYLLSPAGAPPELYAGAWTQRGRLPESHLAIDPAQLATVHAHYHAPLTTLPVSEDVGVGAFWREETGFVFPYEPVELPLERTEYYYSNDPTVRWITELWIHDDEAFQSMLFGWVPYEYRGGETYTPNWNQPVFSPVLPEARTTFDWVTRDGDFITFQLPRYGDREGHGGSVVSTGTNLLYRNGELFGEAPDEFVRFEVPPEPATYRWELDKEQVMFELTPRQKVAWTFPSSHVAEGTPTRIPLLVVRFTPELDERGRAPSGARFCLPLHVDQLDREAPPDVTEPSVEASYDDGASWTRAPVEATRTGWSAFLDHPPQAGYVSLRTSTHDANGYAVEQTLFRAYGLKKRR